MWLIWDIFVSISIYLGPARGAFDYLNDYSEKDKVKMMESLIRYTKTLQDRVEVPRSQHHFFFSQITCYLINYSL